MHYFVSRFCGFMKKHRKSLSSLCRKTALSHHKLIRCVLNSELFWCLHDLVAPSGIILESLVEMLTVKLKANWKDYETTADVSILLFEAAAVDIYSTI